MIFLSALIFSIFITVAVIPVLNRAALKVQLVDLANETRLKIEDGRWKIARRIEDRRSKIEDSKKERSKMEDRKLRIVIRLKDRGSWVRSSWLPLKEFAK